MLPVLASWRRLTESVYRLAAAAAAAAAGASALAAASPAAAAGPVAAAARQYLQIVRARFAADEDVPEVEEDPHPEAEATSDIYYYFQLDTEDFV